MIHYNLYLAMISLGLLFVSCNKTPENPSTPESELIMKINAVQEQIMAQGNITEQEEVALLSLCSIVSHDDGLGNFSPDNRMILKDVEKAPVYMGCEGLNNEETKDCFNEKVTSFIKREFNTNISQELNLSKPNTVEAFFIIDEKGNLNGMKVRDTEVTIQAEILRVLRKMPVLKPATNNGKNVAVLCSFVLSYGNEIGIDMVYIPEIPTD